MKGSPVAGDGADAAAAESAAVAESVTEARGAGSSFFAQPASPMRTSTAPAAANRNADRRIRCIVVWPSVSALHAREPDEHAVQALHVSGGIRELATFRERCLIVKQLRQLGELIAFAHPVQVFHEQIGRASCRERV